MPIELFLSPIMCPAVAGKAILLHSHCPVIGLSEDVKSYSARRKSGQGCKMYTVFDDTNPITTLDQRIYHMVRSRAVKGAYKFYTEMESEIYYPYQPYRVRWARA